MSLLGIVALRQPGATGVEATSLTTVGSALVAGYNGATLLGQSLMPAFNALFLGTLLYRSGLVPRALPVLGLIGAPILVTATVLTMFGVVEQYSAVSGLTALPIAVWEFSLGLYLTFKGFGPPRRSWSRPPPSRSPDGPRRRRRSDAVIATRRVPA